MPTGVYIRKPFTEEAKKNMSISRLERKERLGYLNSKETREKIKNDHIGKTQSEESNVKRSESLKLAYKEGRKDIVKNLTHKGFKHSKETKEKLSEINKGRTWEEKFGKNKAKEMGKKVSMSHLGKKLSEEVKNNMKGHCGIYIRKKENIDKMRNTLKRKYEIGEIKPSMFGKKHSIETRNKLSNILIGKVGRESRNWKGGIAFEPYDINFNKKFKNEIRKRDNQVCMLCGIHRERLNKSLFIHHINYNKELSIPENCIALCNSCHSKTNDNRTHWTKFFQSLLHERYNYNYTELNEPILNVGEIINEK